MTALKKARLKSAKAAKILEEAGIEVPKELKNWPKAAWDSLNDKNILPGTSTAGDNETSKYRSRTAASGQPIPHVCLKVPTGGGKTLLGVAALECIKQDTGFVLWIVPTRAIYEQTIIAFQTREHPYRQMLERTSGGKVKLLQKSEIFTKQDVESYLCVMMLMLPAANRKKNKEFLKIFRDSSGYGSFFPEQDDAAANQQFLRQHSDLDKNPSGGLIKQSLINVLKLIHPTVILDEAHKAYGKNDANNKEFVKSVNQLNPNFVIELSATPKIGISNILVDISGSELRAEEMIKLPIEIHSFSNSDWQHTLTQTHAKLAELETEAHQLQQTENRYIRPIALVRVERTGKAQINQGKIHSENVRKYLIQTLAVPESHIRIQSSEQKQLAGEDLLSATSEVRWIITKDALKEGWDCSFAYLLALLDNTTASTAITQMVGRIMRQPHARITSNDALNRCAIYCYNQEVGKAVKGVKAGLEQEGLTGLGNSVFEHGDGEPPQAVTVKRRAGYKKINIFLPQVLHKDGSKWRLIDYERDILGAVDWSQLNAGKAVALGDPDIIQEIRTTVDIQGQGGKVSTKDFDPGEQLTVDYFVRHLNGLVPNPWQAARIVERFIQQHENKQGDDANLLHNRIYLSGVLCRRLKLEIDAKAEKLFGDKVKSNQIRFHLQTDGKLNYEINKSFEVFVASGERALQGEHGNSIQKSLFELAYESDLNDLEKDFALYLESNRAIYWWHRIAARQEYSLQGWRRHRVYPDFVARRQDNRTLLILETKGNHLKGNEDTKYKQKLLTTLETTYKTARDRGTMKIKEPPAQFRMMFADRWKQDMACLLKK